MSRERELIWVSAELANEYKQLDSVEEQERSVKRVIEQKRLDLDRENELLNENLLLFKSACLAHRKALEQAYKEESEKLDALWEGMGDITTQISTHVTKMTAMLTPVVSQVNALKKELEQLRLYVPEQLVNVTSQVALMDEQTKALLRMLLEVSKK